MTNIFGIDERILALASQAESECTGVFAEIDRIAEINGQKVLKAFIDNRVSEGCLKGTTHSIKSKRNTKTAELNCGLF